MITGSMMPVTTDGGRLTPVQALTIDSCASARLGAKPDEKVAATSTKVRAEGSAFRAMTFSEGYREDSAFMVDYF
jgi:hypothetical protein